MEYVRNTLWNKPSIYAASGDFISQVLQTVGPPSYYINGLRY